jgi:FkbH-like protein
VATAASGLETIAQRSKYFFSIPLPTGNVLIDSLFLQARLVATPDVVAILDEFVEPHQVGPWIEAYAARTGGNRKTIAACVGQLLSQKLLWNLADGDEETRIAAFAADYFDRNPLAEHEPLRAVGSMHERRRMNLYSLPVPRDLSSYTPLEHAVKLMMIGHCDAEFGLDVLRMAARDRNVDLDIVLGHSEDPQLDEQIAHEKPQVLVVTTLTAKRALMADESMKPGRGALAVETPYVAAARAELERLRKITQAPILLHNLQVPTLSPLGRADRGIRSHKARVALSNLQLEALALDFPDVFIVDIEGALALHGKRGLVDDSYGSFGHFGSLRWVTQTPESFKRDVHGIAPPWSRLADAFGGGDVAEYDRIVAGEQLDIIESALALEPKKCVIVDLDGTLWPGVLAETGSPFAMDSPPGHFQEELGAWGFVGLYRGIHEALQALKDRGILLACVSKNDEAVVRKLWRYPEGADETLLTLDDFVAYRINWDEKVDNIQAIARELNLHPSAFAFVDDNPVEREKVAQFLPEVLVLGDNPFTIRWQLLTNALLQPATITDEARRRNRMVASQVERERLRATAVDQAAFRDSLNIECHIDRATAADADRVHELVTRTNQFNTTTRRYTKAELHELMADESSAIYTLRVRDRLTDYGLVGVSCVRGAELELFAMSCRVIGLGVEDTFLARVLQDLAPVHGRIVAKFIPTDRNGPARHLLPSHGFVQTDSHHWELTTSHVL